MGCYDSFGDNQIQLKNGPCLCQHYNVGDSVPIGGEDGFEDGIYVDYDGIVVIKDGIFVAEFRTDQVWNKWGGNINVDISKDNPVIAVMEKVIEECKNKV